MLQAIIRAKVLRRNRSCMAMKAILASCLNVDVKTLEKDFKLSQVNTTSLTVRDIDKLFVSNSEHLTIKCSADK